MAGMISKPKQHETVWLWLYKLLSGVVIVVLLSVHFVVNHLVAPGGLLTYADILRYYSNPIVPVMEIAFLVFAVTHSFVGMRSIFLDLNPSPRLIRFVDWALVILGGGAIVYGTWLVLLIASGG
jgi:succinate dehydrogenase / fumarate reductase membrane anchor subunit